MASSEWSHEFAVVVVVAGRLDVGFAADTKIRCQTQHAALLL